MFLPNQYFFNYFSPSFSSHDSQGQLFRTLLSCALEFLSTLYPGFLYDVNDSYHELMSRNDWKCSLCDRSRAEGKIYNISIGGGVVTWGITSLQM